MRLSFAYLVVTSVALFGCSQGVGDGAPVFPIIGNDPEDLVASMEWGVTPALEEFPPDQLEVLELLETSTPEVVRIAVGGSGCPPSAQVQVTGSPEAVNVEMILGGSIAPRGLECSEVLTTHEMVIRFHDPIDLDAIELSARRTGNPG